MAVAGVEAGDEAEAADEGGGGVTRKRVSRAKREGKGEEREEKGLKSNKKWLKSN